MQLSQSIWGSPFKHPRNVRAKSVSSLLSMQTFTHFHRLGSIRTTDNLLGILIMGLHLYVV